MAQLHVYLQNEDHILIFSVQFTSGMLTHGITTKHKIY